MFMKSFSCVFYYDFSIIIYEYLHILDLFKLAQILENNVPSTFSKLKRDVWISDSDFGERLIGFFKNIKLKIGRPKLFRNLPIIPNIFPSLIELDLSKDYYYICDNELNKMVNLTSLNLSDNSNITNNGLVYFTNLTSLNLNNNKNITDEGLEHLVNLTNLDLSYNQNITNDGIKGLTNLTNLDLSINYTITDNAGDMFLDDVISS